MRRVIARNAPFTREVWERDDLVRHFEATGETFKAEWAREIRTNEPFTVYRQGDWMDMCRGPHMTSTGRVDPQAFKLTRVSGALGPLAGAIAVRAINYQANALTLDLDGSDPGLAGRVEAALRAARRGPQPRDRTDACSNHRG